jgi:RimJ/RimL family protein N-acetyltransferase
MAHAGFPNGLNQSVEQTKELIKENETKLSQICMIETEGKPIGEMSFGIENRIAEMGIKICERAYQNRGLGTKLIHMLIKFLFNDPKINSNGHIKKIILNTDLKNIRAQHVYEKIGFRRMYVHENSWKDQLGNLRSSVGYELTRGQYKDR